MEIFFIHFIALYTFLHLNFLFIRLYSTATTIWLLYFRYLVFALCRRNFTFLYWTKWIFADFMQLNSKASQTLPWFQITHRLTLFLLFADGSKKKTSSGAWKRLIVASLEFLIHLAIKFRPANSSYHVEQHKDSCNFSFTIWYRSFHTFFMECK